MSTAKSLWIGTLRTRAGQAIRAATELPSALLVAAGIAAGCTLYSGDNALHGDSLLVLFAGGLSVMGLSGACQIYRRANAWSRAKGWLLQAASLLPLGIIAAFLPFHRPCEMHLFLFSAALAILSAGLLVHALGCERKDWSHFPKLLESATIALATAILIAIGTIVLNETVQLLDFAGHDQLDKITRRLLLTTFCSALPLIALIGLVSHSLPTFRKPLFLLLRTVALPLYLAFLGFLSLYALQCLVAWHVPDGKVYSLVLVASIAWFPLRLLLADQCTFGCRTFCRWGGALLLPLILLQAIALAQRIAAYSLTPMRLTALYLVIFSALVALVDLFRPQALRVTLWPYLATLVPVLLLSPLNPFDLGLTLQSRRLGRFRERLRNASSLSREEQVAVMEIADILNGSSPRGVYWRGYWSPCSIGGAGTDSSQFRDAFRAEWGFPYLPDYKRGEYLSREPDDTRFAFQLPRLSEGDFLPIHPGERALLGTIRQSTNGLHFYTNNIPILDLTPVLTNYPAGSPPSSSAIPLPGNLRLVLLGRDCSGLVRTNASGTCLLQRSTAWYEHALLLRSTDTP
ncbi:MAG: hypothetical protein SPK06_01035 [Kiritimatiellia bacterium]|nr:hypothetical protein [Kiritimatiellia bacterium]